MDESHPAPQADAAAPDEPGARVIEVPEGQGHLGDQVVQQLKTVFDPEIPVDVYELGLIYKVAIDADGVANIRMTLTSPMCPAAEELPPEVETKTRAVEGVTSVTLDLVWDPPWSPAMMSESAKLELGMY